MIAIILLLYHGAVNIDKFGGLFDQSAQLNREIFRFTDLKTVSSNVERGTCDGLVEDVMS